MDAANDVKRSAWRMNSAWNCMGKFNNLGSHWTEYSENAKTALHNIVHWQWSF